MRIEERIEPRIGVQVDEARAVFRGGLLDHVHVVPDPQSQRVRVCLVRLDVVRPERRIPAVNRRQEPDRHAGILAFQVIHHGGDPSAERRIAVRPVAERNVRVEVVRAGEDDDLVDIARMIREKALRLSVHVLPLVPVDAVDERHDAQVAFQEIPVVRRAPDVARVGDRIPKERHLAPAPSGLPDRLAGSRAALRSRRPREVDHRDRPDVPCLAHRGRVVRVAKARAVRGRRTGIRRKYHERDLAFGAVSLQAVQKHVQTAVVGGSVHQRNAPLQLRLDAVLVDGGAGDRVPLAKRDGREMVARPAEDDHGGLVRPADAREARDLRKRVGQRRARRRQVRPHARPIQPFARNRERRHASAGRRRPEPDDWPPARLEQREGQQGKERAPHLPTTSDTGR